jgi:hypothetical protein
MSNQRKTKGDLAMGKKICTIKSYICDTLEGTSRYGKSIVRMHSNSAFGEKDSELSVYYESDLPSTLVIGKSYDITFTEVDEA